MPKIDDDVDDDDDDDDMMTMMIMTCFLHPKESQTQSAPGGWRGSNKL